MTLSQTLPGGGKDTEKPEPGRPLQRWKESRRVLAEREHRLVWGWGHRVETPSSTRVPKEELEWWNFSGHKSRRVPGWGMEKFLKVSSEEADGIPRVEVQRDGKNQSHARICQRMCAPPPASTLPIVGPHQAQSEQWGSGNILPAARGMWDWMVANLRLPGFIRSELAVSWGALEWTKGAS